MVPQAAVTYLSESAEQTALRSPVSADNPAKKAMIFGKDIPYGEKDARDGGRDRHLTGNRKHVTPGDSKDSR